MKHFNLATNPASREETALLFNKHGEEFEPFSIVMRSMNLKGFARSTQLTYAGHIARFLDYLTEANKIIGEPTRKNILTVILNYKSFLLFGTDAQDPQIRKVARALSKKIVTHPRSLFPINAAISYFLSVSDSESLLADQGLLFDSLVSNERIKAPRRTRKKIEQNSVIASCISSASLVISANSGLFGKIPHPDRFTKEPIPYDKLIKIIKATKSPRNRLLYLVLAATGCRLHEALQIRLKDIDVERREISLVDPFTRINKGITELQSKKLRWKGRCTSETFLIEPFKSWAFDCLEEYLRKFRIGYTLHDFLFQKEDGAPLFVADQKTIREQFNNSKRDAGLPDDLNSYIHGIRHSYGVYTLNYLPTGESTFGLPIAYVRIFMGHSQLKNTEVYARYDINLAAIALEYANQFMKAGEMEHEIEDIYMKFEKQQREFVQDKIKSMRIGISND